MVAPVLLRRRLLWRTGAVATLLTLALVGCGQGSGEPAGSGSPAASPAESPSGTTSQTPSESPSGSPSEAPAGPTLEVRVTGGEVTPVAQEVDLAVGETLTIEVRSDRAGELHVHSDPEQLFTFGRGSERFRVTLQSPGSVDVEEHESGALIARLLVR